MTADHQYDLPGSEALDAKTTREWIHLSGQVMVAALHGSCARLNQFLESASDREPQSPLAPCYRFWVADNLAADRLYGEAVKAYDTAINSCHLAPRFPDSVDPIIGMLYHKAGAAALHDDYTTAINSYELLSQVLPDDARPLFQAGLLAEEHRDFDRASDLYRRRARSSGSHDADDLAEWARRGALRLADPHVKYSSDVDELADRIRTALERRDSRQLDQLISKTHFAIGVVGGHAAFEDLQLLEHFYRDLANSQVVASRSLSGSGKKLYLATEGWKGVWFQGQVSLLLTKAPQGWQWTGIGITLVNERWLERWRPTELATNQPLPFDLLAPWPADQSFTAGGLLQFGEQTAQIASAGILGGLVAFNFSRSRCGFGARGFYYNSPLSHTGQSAFAIDFTRYRRYVPLWPESGGTPVLAPRDGTVRNMYAAVDSGNPSIPNFVELFHKDPATDTNKYISRYLHLEGPWKIPVRWQMAVVTGNRLGLMDDTGTSWLDHLHFSIHDLSLNGIRPTPLNGVTLHDDDGGTCVYSTNIERVGVNPMKEAISFAGQNWLITPAARPVNQPQPTVENQKWLLVLSGVAVVDVKGFSESQWMFETVLIRPDLTGPINRAIADGGIPRPAGSEGQQYWAGFQVEQWAPFAAVSAMYNEEESNHSGFAVNVWRPHTFQTRNDFSNTLVPNLFDGIQVDVAVRDTDAWLYRVSYNITLLGRVVFGPILFT